MPVQYKLLLIQTEKLHHIKKKMADGVQASIAANENSKRLTYVPKFYGNAKDTLTARKFIERIKQAATYGAWNKTRKCAEFCHLLQLAANGFMSATLKKYKTAHNNWDNHKKLFLQFYKFYNIKGTTKLNFFALHEMKQGPIVNPYVTGGPYLIQPDK